MNKLKVLILVFCFNVTDLFSQCAMCRAVLESQEDQSISAGLNDGIMYLMAIPYILVAVMGFILYKKFKK
ncbi:MAG: hypothetical protein P8K72_00875 [Flavobacteriaceae bacterium]|jgi:hypothetical protein|nr:hypothetical protein [Flavobacteriaceae bacterium]MED5354701.1 hypothetical protein [Bacteroidota bacterium]|tara:strand:+ start:25 stop:234 length:210 start_codon:yes stop_codon:yes gene_type:complete